MTGTHSFIESEIYSAFMHVCVYINPSLSCFSGLIVGIQGYAYVWNTPFCPLLNFLLTAVEQGGLPQYVSAPGLVQQINQLQTELQTLRDEMHHSLLQDKHKCINDLQVSMSFNQLQHLYDWWIENFSLVHGQRQPHVAKS